MQWIDSQSWNQLTLQELSYLLTKITPLIAQKAGAVSAAPAGFAPMPGAAGAAAVPVAAKRGAPPKGVAPPHLVKRGMWDKHVYPMMLTNGWKPFTFAKPAGKTKVQVMLPGSVFNGSMHVFGPASLGQDDSYRGQPAAPAHAQGYASLLKDTEDPEYKKWEATYVPPADPAAPVAPSVPAVAAVAASSSSTAAAPVVIAAKPLTVTERMAKLAAARAKAAPAAAAPAAAAPPAWTMPLAGEPAKPKAVQGVQYLITHDSAVLDASQSLVGYYIQAEDRVEEDWALMPEEVLNVYAPDIEVEAPIPE